MSLLIGSVGVYLLRFFFQAEDGIRDTSVTGVQTCALPISPQQFLPRYTVGQRRGLPGGFREPMFVVEIRPETRTVVIGPREELLGRGVVAREEIGRAACRERVCGWGVRAARREILG